MKLLSKAKVRWLRLNLVLLGLVLLASMSFPVATVSQKLNDFFFRLRPPQPPSPQVALVLIDDATLTQYGRWPWQRQRLAQLVRAVADQQPSAIGLDILLVEPEDEINDAALESAIRSAPNVVLAAKISGTLDNTRWIDPLPRFARAAKGIGHVQAIVDSDGLCRSIPAEEPTDISPLPARKSTSPLIPSIFISPLPVVPSTLPSIVVAKKSPLPAVNLTDPTASRTRTSPLPLLTSSPLPAFDI